MAITFTTNMDKTWKYLIKSGTTEAGAAGLMGNLYAKSGVIPNRVEILCLKRLKEAGKNYTDKTYTAAVDNGTISRAEFVHPLPNRQYGYGLWQVTSPLWKTRFYDFIKKKKKASIGSIDAQLEYLVRELKKYYPGVWKKISTSNDLAACSDKVLLDFEIPADTGTTVRNNRAAYAREFYSHYAKTDPIQAVIDVAAGEVGYIEKANSSSLDSKTGNPGFNNYTKYWRDVYPQFQGLEWCACFVSWCFMKAFGLETAKAMLKHWPFTYCPTLAALTTNKTPERGSIVLFWRNGEYAHTELVIEVTAQAITTIGGNTSAGNSVVPNGGGVYRKTYQRDSLNSNNKYFIPDYSLAKNVSVPASKPAKQNDSAALSEIPKETGTVIATDLAVRTWAGIEYLQIKSYPVLKRGETVGICDSIAANDGTEWYYVKINNVYGFVHSAYIEKT